MPTMAQQPDARLMVLPAPKLTACLGGVVALLGMLVLGGWAFDLQTIKQIAPGFATMKANTALCFVLIGGSLVALSEPRPMTWAHRAAQTTALIVGLLGLATLSQDLLGLNYGIDQLLFRDEATSSETGAPGRMSPGTAACFTLAGPALMLLQRKKRTVALIGQALAFTVLTIGCVALIGYTYGVEALYNFAPFTSMAVHTAGGFTLVAIALLAIKPMLGPVSGFTQQTLGGRIARELLPLTIGATYCLGLLRVLGERQGFYDSEFGTAAFAVAQIMLVGALIAYYARLVGTSDHERQVAQAATQLERNRLETTLISIGDAVVATDADEQVTFLNPAAERLTGWSSDEARGRPVTEVFSIIDETSGQRIEHPVAQVLRSRKTLELTSRNMLVGRGHRRTPIEDTAAPIVDHQSELTGAVLVLQDATQRRRTDLVRSQLAAIVASTDDAVISKNLDGVISSWNRAAQQLYGYTPEEAIGKHISLIVPDNRRDELGKIMDRLRAGEKISHLETIRQHADGHLVDVSLTISPVHDNERQVIGASAIARDITTRLHHEKQLRQMNDHLEQRVLERTAEVEDREAKLQMLARELSVAEHRERQRIAYALHENFQQLLVAAKMTVSTLGNGENAQAVERANSLIQDAVEASRSLAVELHPPVLYDQGLAAAFHWLARHFENLYGLKTTVQAQKLTQPPEPAIRSLVFQAVRELLLNVVKHAQTDTAWVRLSEENDRIRVEVQDQGVGCNRDPIEAGREKGFGLFSIKQRIELLGGSFQIEYDEGCRVRMVVPPQVLEPEQIKAITPHH